MTYNKPKLTALGDAVCAIQSEPKTGIVNDGDGSGPQRTLDPAYDLDE